MSWGSQMAWRARMASVFRPRALAGCLVLAVTALAATVTLDAESTMGAATVPVQPQSADAAKFEAFVREVGIDMTTVPIAIRRQWASAPRVGIDDCAIPGTHEGHGHGSDRVEQAVKHPGAVTSGDDQYPGSHAAVTR